MSNFILEYSKEELEKIIKSCNILIKLLPNNLLSMEIESLKRNCIRRSNRIDNLLDLDYFSLIGKYFKNENDFINLIKVSKKFKNLLEIFNYNPISNKSLFPNMKIQHHYNEEDEFDFHYSEHYIWYNRSPFFENCSTQYAGTIHYEK